MTLAIADERLEGERARLVRLCYRITGSADAAEDLAQETLYEALRNAHKLHDSSGYSSWLSAIARNVCRRWSERRGRDSSRLISQTEGQELPEPEDDYDLEVELERSELVELLDRALGMLPQESREVLIERYVRDSPHAEIARKLGLTGPAVAKRIERGRLRLKQVLSTYMLRDSMRFGLERSLYDDWDETDIWCPVCGRRHLLARFVGGELWLVCTPCESLVATLPVSHYSNGGSPELFRGIRGYRAANDRLDELHWQQNGRGVAGQGQSCLRCGREMHYRIGYELPSRDHYAALWCDTCRNGYWCFKPCSLLLASPESLEFRREHPRVRLLPEREVEAGGVPALFTGYESLTGCARLEGVFVRDTFEPIAIHVTPGS